MAIGREVGRVSIRVLPDASRFETDLRRIVARFEKTLEVNIPVKLDTRGLGAELKAAEARLKAATAGGIDIPVRADSSGLERFNNQLNVTDRSVTNVRRGGGLLSRMFSVLGSSMGAAVGAVFQLAGSVFGLGAQFGSVGVKVGALLGQLVAVSILAGVVGGALGLITSALLGIAGAVGAGLGALPAILAAVAVPAGAVMLGMDGIKRAAETLKPAFEALKEKVSAAFELGLIPAFETLKTIMPTLEVGFVRMADQLSAMARGVATFLASAEGVELIRNVFSGVEMVVGATSGKLGELGRQLLATAGYAPMFRILSDIINNVADGFARWLQNARESGSLYRTFGAIRDILKSAGDWFWSFVDAGMEFLTFAGPGISEFFDRLREAFSTVDFAALGKSFGDLVRSFGNIDPNIVATFVEGVKFLFDQITRFNESGGLNMLIGALTGLMGIVAALIEPFIWLAEGIGWVLEQFGVTGSASETFAGQMEANMGRVGASAAPVPPAFQAGLAPLPGIGTAISAHAAQNLSNGFNAIVAPTRRSAEQIAADFGVGLGNIRPIADAIGKDTGNIMSNNMPDVGRRATDGVRIGIEAGKSSVIGAAVRFALAAFQAAKSVLGIGSPSKLFATMGDDTAQGYIEGMRRRRTDVVHAMRDMVVQDVGQLGVGLSVDANGALRVNGKVGLSPAAILALVEGIVRALTGSTLRVDGPGVARLVNTVNARNAAR